jgi:hypothetical protein
MHSSDVCFERKSGHWADAPQCPLLAQACLATLAAVLRFVAREQLRRRSPAGLLLEIDECQFLSAGRREAAFGELGHGHECCSRSGKAGGFMNRLLIIGLLVMFTLPL